MVQVFARMHPVYPNDPNEEDAAMTGKQCVSRADGSRVAILSVACEKAE